jgi:DNA-binding NarL/FixJ family response regulator
MTPDKLGPDDLELLALLASGLSFEAISRRLDTSDRTLRRRIRGICDRLGLGTTVEAIAWAARRGLV